MIFIAKLLVLNNIHLATLYLFTYTCVDFIYRFHTYEDYLIIYNTHPFACINVRMHAYKHCTGTECTNMQHIFTHIRAASCTHTTYIHSHTCSYAQTYKNALNHSHVNTSTHKHTSTHIHTHIHSRPCIFTHTHMHANTRTHTHTLYTNT